MTGSSRDRRRAAPQRGTGRQRRSAAPPSGRTEPRAPAVDTGHLADDQDDRDDLADAPGGVRLQKVLAAAGVGSRRHCEEMIAAGRVEVDGEVVRRFGARVDAQRQLIRVDGRRLPTRQDLAYVAFNKPAQVLTAMSDERGRATVADFLGDAPGRLFHVGRLDYDSEGLVLLTNDGELAHRLAHPRYGVRKTYLADVPAPVPRSVGRRLAAGVALADGPAAADAFRVVERAGPRALVEITVHEGRNRIVRRMLAEVGHPVARLVRTDVGPVRLGALKPGTTRNLTARETGELYAAVGL